MENFEGPEKKLEVILSAPQTGLRDNTDRRWDRVVRACGAEIIKRECAAKLDSYLLSESSLFVWNDRILLITCGKTTPTKALPIILKYVAKPQIAYLFYERKNLNFPNEQPTDVDDDLAYLRTHFAGNSIRLGPACGDHLHVFYYAKPNGCPLPDTSVQILMHDIDPAVATTFYYDSTDIDRQNEMLTRLKTLYPAMKVENHFFYPQGYSLNGISEDNYFTIHVTPQPEASYVSFESNMFNHESAGVVQKIISLFNPLRFSVVLTATTKGQFEDLHNRVMVEPPGYQAIDQTFCEFDHHYTTIFSNFLKQRH